MLVVIGCVMLLNYFVFLFVEKAQDIIEKKPRFYDSHCISIVVVLLFFLFTNSLLFWAADYLLYVKGNCK